MRGESALSARADGCRDRCLAAGRFVVVSYCRLRLVTVLRLRLRGLCGRSFQHATVPQPVPSWTPADRWTRPRSGARAPDTDEISSTVLRDSSPLYNQEHAWLKDQVQGTRRAGVEPQGFARPSGESTPSQKSIWFLPSCHLRCYTSVTSRGGQGNGGNRPERRVRARRGMRVDRPVHPCSFGDPDIPL